MKKIEILIVVNISICLFCSCNKKKQNIVTIEKDNLIMKGDIINDTIFNDTILYYNLSNTLMESKFFKDGVLNGNDIRYDSNGKVFQTTAYSYGVKNGFNTYYNPSGKMFYRDFYYYNLTVGPVEFFDTSGNIKRFFFANLQNETLMDIDYKNWKGIKEIYNSCINFTSNIAKEDSIDKVSIFLYLINPPKFSFKYSIFKEKKPSDTDITEVRKIQTDSSFTTVLLPVLPDSERYCVGVDIYDSIIGKRTIIYNDLKDNVADYGQH
jgi:hypothetical protein